MQAIIAMAKDTILDRNPLMLSPRMDLETAEGTPMDTLAFDIRVELQQYGCG
jgi:hypothetical protein